MKEIKCYHANDPELLRTIAHLLGSPEWYKEHGQSLMRYSGKTFYLLFIDGAFASMFTTYKGVIGDCHTEPEYRERGCMKELLSAYEWDNATIITKNPVMERIAGEIGFLPVGKRGSYTVYKVQR